MERHLAMQLEQDDAAIAAAKAKLEAVPQEDKERAAVKSLDRLGRAAFATAMQDAQEDLLEQRGVNLVERVAEIRAGANIAEGETINEDDTEALAKEMRRRKWSTRKITWRPRVTGAAAKRHLLTGGQYEFALQERAARRWNDNPTLRYDTAPPQTPSPPRPVRSREGSLGQPR